MAGSIQIDVLANTQKLVSGMNRAERTVKKSAQAMGNAMKVFAGIFVGGKLISAINKTNSEIDKLGKTAAKLGVGTEQLGALHYAAEQSGVSINTLNMALQRSTRRVAEAAQGTGEAVKALKELGLSAVELNKLSPDKQLEAIADAMEGVTTQSDKVRLSMKLFDSEGVALVNMLKGGSAALKAYAADAASLGILLSSSDVKGVEAANDAMNRLGKSIGLVAQNISVNLAPYIKYAADWMVNLATSSVDAGTSMGTLDAIVKVVAQGIIGSFQAMQLAVSGYTSVFLYLKTAVLNVSGDVMGATVAWNAFHESIAEGDAIFLKLAGTIDGSGEALKTFLDDIEAIKLGFKSVELSSGKAMGNIAIDTKVADKALKSVNTTLASGMTSAFRKAMDGATSFGDIFANIAKDIVAQLIHILVVQQAVNAAMGAMGFGGGGTAVAGAMATGGSVTQSGAYLVGERGPEIVNLGAGDHVTPNSAIGGGTTVNVYNNTSSDVSVQEDEAGKIDIIISAIAQEITRGTGVLGSSFENRYGLSKA